jgi:hypothetical protein
MNKYLRLLQDLETKGTGTMTCFGNSMTPILKSGQTLTFIRQENYEVGDIVFCRVKNHYIDAHKILKKSRSKGYLIGNNHGHENGWTRTVYGKVQLP